jgi:GDP-4-dehydro-6-deoxy-D-mannose reductase
LSHADPWFTLENNIRAQLNVLEAVVQGRLSCSVLVVGSSEEYGKILPDEVPINEETPLRPANPYAVSKIAQDFLGLQYYLAHQVHVVRVRPFNHIGPRQRLGFVAADFAAQIAAIEAGKRPPEVRVGSLSVERDFSDVRDIVRGYYLALTQGRPGDVYNLGAGRSYQIGFLLDTLVAMCERPVKIVQDAARLRPVDVPRTLADCRKLRGLTGWQPEIPFEQSLRDVLDDWRNRVQRGAPDPTPTEPSVKRGGVY